MMKWLILNIIAAATLCRVGLAQTKARIMFLDLAPLTSPVYNLDGFHYVPVSSLSEMGLSVQDTNGDVKVSYGSQTANVSTLRKDRTDWVSLEGLCPRIDAELSIAPSSHDIFVRSHIRLARFVAGHLSIGASLPVPGKSTYNSKTGNLEITFLDSTLSQDAVTDLDSGVGISQLPGGQVLIKVPMAQPPSWVGSAISKMDSFDFDCSVKAKVANVGTGPVPSLFKFQTVNDHEYGLWITMPAASAGAAVVTRVNPNELKIVVPNVLLDTSSIRDTAPIKITGSQDSPTQATITIDTPVPFGFRLSQNDTGLGIALVRPQGPTGTISGKVIQIDSGHGGKDTGAVDTSSGVREKDITLQVGLLTAKALSEAGAVVILSRDHDVFIPLEQRPAIGEKNHSDLFVSIHVNSAGRKSKISGSISFYHSKDPVSSTLAYCVESQFANLGGIPAIGTWSDYRIYPGEGFSVLRHSKVPAVLLELGFIENKNDRSHLLDPDYQQSISQAILKGIQVFYGDNRVIPTTDRHAKRS